MTNFHSVVILAAISSNILAFATAVVNDGDLSSFRLPYTFIPQSYNITLRPYLFESDAERRFTFDGEVHINVTKTSTNSTLVMHAKNLNFTLSEYWRTEQPNIKIQLPNPVSDPITDKITLDLVHALDVGTIYTIHFIYIGYMNEESEGFYRSSYTDERNVSKWLGITHFEPYYARRAFPSFDEPKFKATFDVSVIRHNSMKAFSNTRLKKSVLNGNYFTDTFERTPLMSTYTLAVFISDFNERWDGKFGIIVRPKYYGQTEYGANIGKQIINELGQYLNMSYYELGNHKLQLAAIPDFNVGAMENWGLITYKEKALLYDSKLSAFKDKQSILSLVAHELVHMWFGNLVTCEWWSYLWLSEGFANYFSSYIAARIDPGLNMEQQFVVDTVHTIMVTDSTNKTTFMTNEGFNFTRDSIDDIFNQIVYRRAAAFIRMIKHSMGEQNFQKSVQEYLLTYKYRNTVPADLLAKWTKYWPASSRQHAFLVFKSFTEQVGYPVVTVEVAGDGMSMKISQTRFLAQPNDGSDASLLYTIPFTYTTSAENDFSTTTPKLFLEATRTENFEQPVEWVIANIQETGYYRVNYDSENWQQIHRALLSPNWGGIHELNRAQIVDDLFQLAKADVIDYDLALPILGYLSTELNYLPLKAAFEGYSYLANHLNQDDTDFSIFIREQLEKIYNQLGFDENSNDTAFDIYNRNQILLWSCKYGNTRCITQAKKHFSTLSMKPVPANIRHVVYCTALREGNENDFNILFNKFKDETFETERLLILKSLGCVKDYNLIEKYYNLIFSENIRRQNKITALTDLIEGSSGNFMHVFAFVTRDIEKIARELNGYSDVATIINSIAKYFTKRRHEKMLQEFIEANQSKFGTSIDSLKAAKQTVAQNLAWSKNNLNKLKTFLKRRVKGNANVTSPFKLLTIALVPLVLDYLLDKN